MQLWHYLLLAQKMYIHGVCACAPCIVNIGAAKCLTAIAFSCHTASVSSIQRFICLFSFPLPHLMSVFVLFMSLLRENNHADLIGRSVIQLVIWGKWIRGFKMRGGLGKRRGLSERQSGSWAVSIWFFFTNPKLQPLEDSDLLLTCVHH